MRAIRVVVCQRIVRGVTGALFGSRAMCDLNLKIAEPQRTAEVRVRPTAFYITG